MVVEGLKPSSAYIFQVKLRGVKKKSKRAFINEKTKTVLILYVVKSVS